MRDGEDVAAGRVLQALPVELAPESERGGLVRIPDRRLDHVLVPEDHVAVDLRELGRRRVFVGDEGRELAGGGRVVVPGRRLLHVAPGIESPLSSPQSGGELRLATRAVMSSVASAVERGAKGRR